MTHVVTLMAPPGRLDAPLVEHLAAIIGGRIDWLAPAQAADLFTHAAPEPDAVAAALEGKAVDVAIQPAEGRRKRLLVADMDSTIVTTETLDELAAHAGLKDRIAAITQRSMNGEIDFRDALIERVGLLRGLPLAALHNTWAATEMMPGAAELIGTMRAQGAICALVSGGFTFFTSRVADRLGFQVHRANTLLDDGVALTGGLADPILTRTGKCAVLHELAAAHGLRLDDAMALGDGANDLDMLRDAGIGVAYHAKPIVARAAQVRIDHCDLRALLFMQGFRQSDAGA